MHNKNAAMLAGTLTQQVLATQAQASLPLGLYAAQWNALLFI
jgi:hypothetical protein